MGNKGPIRSKQSAHGGARVGVSGAGVSCATKGEAFQRTIINIIILIVIMSNTSIGSPIIISICLTIMISIIAIRSVMPTQMSFFVACKSDTKVVRSPSVRASREACTTEPGEEPEMRMDFAVPTQFYL